MSTQVLTRDNLIEGNMQQEVVVEIVQIEEEQDDSFIQDVDLLLEQGIAPQDVEKLKSAGINTIKGVEMTTRKHLLLVPGFDQNKIDKIKAACCKFSVDNAFVTASEVCEQRNQIFKLSTGSKQFDNILGGGIEAMSITEVFGEFGTGKTQLSHTLCVTAQMPGPNGYIGGKVIFMDTEHTFRPDRLKTIAERFNLDQTTVLDNVLYTRAYNSEHQYELLNKVAAKLHEEAGVFKLLIVDSVMALFRVDFSGRGEMMGRQQRLGQLLSRLQNISEEYNIAVFITNQIVSDLSNGVQGQDPKPIGGNILGHASTTRVKLSKLDGAKRMAKIYDSPDLSDAETVFIITPGGLDDPVD